MITNHWNDKLNLLPSTRKDIYFTEEYCKLHAFDNRIACAFVYEENDALYILPILIGQIPDSNGLCDFETPYGYGGPITNNDSPAFVQAAEDQLRKDCYAQGIVAGFIRFHPILDNVHLAAGAFDIMPDRKTVAIDLSAEEQQIWQDQLHSKNRNTIRKAERNGFTFLIDESFAFLEDFKRLYRQTMQRVAAEEFYNFDDTYFANLVYFLKNRACIGIVQQEDRSVAAAIFLYNGPWAHYHLAGSEYEGAIKGANNLLLYQAALYLKTKGAQILHLGGGTDQDESNSLLAFKRKFSPLTYQFSIGKGIFIEGLYNALCSKWEKAYPEKIAEFGKMVLKYRF